MDPTIGIETTPASPAAPVIVPSSQMTAHRILRAVHRLTAGRIRDLNVEVRGSRIVLEGKAASFYAKQLAQTAAMQLAEGSRVVNRIEVL